MPDAQWGKVSGFFCHEMRRKEERVKVPKCKTGATKRSNLLIKARIFQSNMSSPSLRLS